VTFGVIQMVIVV